MIPGCPLPRSFDNEWTVQFRAPLKGALIRMQGIGDVDCIPPQRSKRTGRCATSWNGCPPDEDGKRLRA